MIRYVRTRPFFILLGGAGFAHLINFASAPLLTRLYTPEAFGLLSLFATALAVAGSIAGGRYEQAIPGEMSDKYAGELVMVVGMLAVVLASLVPLGLSSIAPLFDSPAHLAEIGRYLGPAVFAYALSQALINWLIRKGGFSTTSATKVLQALAVFAGSVCFAGTDQGLIIANMVGHFAVCLALILGARHQGWTVVSMKLRDLWLLLRMHVRFPMLGVLPALLDSLSMLLPVYWIAMFFSTTDTGHFGLTRQVLAAPVGLISVVVTQLLMKRLAEAKESRASMYPALRRVILLVSGPAMVFAVVVSVAGPELFAVVFGETWQSAGELARWMVWAYVAPMLISPLSVVLIVLRRVGTNGAWQTLHFVGLSMLLSFVGFRDMTHFVQVLALFEVVAYVTYAVLIASVASEWERKRHAA